MFSRADLNNDQCLQLGEVLSWFEGNVEGIHLFKRFQPMEQIGKQEYNIFNKYIAYSQQQIKILYQIIQKEYKKLGLSPQDYQPLNVLVNLYYNGPFKKSQSTNFITEINSSTMTANNNNFNTTNSKRHELNDSNFKRIHKRSIVEELDEIEKEKKVNFSLLSKRVSKEKRMISLPKFNKRESVAQETDKGFNFDIQSKQNFYIKKTSSKKVIRQNSKPSLLNTTTKFNDKILNTTRSNKQFGDLTNRISKSPKTLRHFKSPTINSWQATTLNISYVQELKKKSNKKNFRNIIILKGKTVTKKQIFNLRDYFQSMSAGKKNISIQNFIDSFQDQKYNHMKSVAASLFNFLDRDQNGKVTFKELIQKLYPDLTSNHYEIIKLWNNQYNQTFNLQRKIKANRQHEELKKRILPKTCSARYQEIFNFFDRDRKGYVNFQDIKAVLSEVSTEKQLLEAFEENDKDRDGKLNIKEFMHILLPLDLEIQGI